MSKIDDLIQQYCPNGVAFKKLGEVAAYVRGITYNKKDETGNASGLKVLRANNIRLSTNTLNFDDVKIVANSVKVRDNQRLKAGDILICAASGSKAHIGKVAFINEGIDYTFGGFMAVLRTTQTLQSKFLFHLLVGSNFSKYLETALNTTTINNLNAEIMHGFSIPVPPLPVQAEIVNILDKFTQLEAELEAELEARRAQYEHYRNKLLSFSELENRGGYSLMTLGEICTTTSNIRWQDTTGKSFQYIDLSSVDRDFHCITETQTINQGNAPSRAQRIVQTDDIIFGTTRPTLKRYCMINSKYNKQICSTGFCVLRPKTDEVLSKWIYYQISLPKYYDYMEESQRGAGYPAVSDNDVKSYKIPVPSLAEQERIVGILDKFDALVNDISVGLPAELNARRQQYEHYRNRLLSFEPTGAAEGQ